MNNEIKEILDRMQELVKHKYDKKIQTYNLFDDIQGLLDYITNLQEQLHQASLDIQELTERDIECPSWCDKLTNLQEENERLNKECDTYMEIATKKQQRIDKAIDKLYCYGEVFDRKILQQFQKEMLSTLQGEDKE